MCQQVWQKDRGTQEVKERVRGHRWRVEDSAGSLDNLKESGSIYNSSDLATLPSTHTSRTPLLSAAIPLELWFEAGAS